MHLIESVNILLTAMEPRIYLSLRIIAFCLLFLSASTFGRERPNIVLILSDDQAWTDYGFMGHAEIRTRHLDKLAERSLVFERGYTASPLCRPSLASLLTGKFPHQHGITGNDVDGTNNRESLDIPLRIAFHKHPSFVRLLTSHGYLTHQSGKWWEGSHGDGGFTHGMMPQPARHGSAKSLAIGRDGMAPVTDFIDHAVAEKKPFFIWYAPFLPHTPHNPPQRLLEKYQTPGQAEDVTKYHAMCEWFDETCGILLDHLEKRSLMEHTVIMYICDNGWAAASTNRKDPAQIDWSQYALRSKGSPYENGIRTPVLISWHGKITPKRDPAFAHAIDFFPTIASLAGFKAPDGLTGINLLDEKAVKSRDAVFGVTHSIHNMSPGNPESTLQYLWGVENEWKIIIRHDGVDTTAYRNVHLWDKARVRLYRIKDDPQEAHDVSAKHPEVAARMKQRVADWYAQTAILPRE
ncbi:MAG: Arylsulfatase precursor [Verrucomicrobiota bacterium]|jgi:arylsulfatase A-like enzyme